MCSYDGRGLARTWNTYARSSASGLDLLPHQDAPLLPTIDPFDPIQHISRRDSIDPEPIHHRPGLQRAVCIIDAAPRGTRIKSAASAASQQL